MQLIDDLEHGKHYQLLNVSNWTKLKASFGGGPDIPFFQYQVEVTRDVPEVGTVTEKESRHDFNPIVVRAHIFKRNMNGIDQVQAHGFLVSKHLL